MGAPLNAVVRDRYKLIAGAFSGESKTLDDVRFYDLHDDPAEADPKVGDSKPKQLLVELLKRKLISMSERRGESQATEMNEEQVERLRSLGYIGE